MQQQQRRHQVLRLRHLPGYGIPGCWRMLPVPRLRCHRRRQRTRMCWRRVLTAVPLLQRAGCWAVPGNSRDLTGRGAPRLTRLRNLLSQQCFSRWPREVATLLKTLRAQLSPKGFRGVEAGPVMLSYWRQLAAPIIAKVLAEMAGRPEVEVRAVLRAAYPF